VTAPLTAQELDEGQRLLEAISGYRGGLGSTEANGRLEDWTNRHVEALLASARQLLELTEALLYLHARNFDGHGWHPDKVVDLALRVGWQPRKDGGNG
jgi:hypothetical protein